MFECRQFKLAINCKLLIKFHRNYAPVIHSNKPTETEQYLKASGQLFTPTVLLVQGSLYHTSTLSPHPIPTTSPFTTLPPHLYSPASSSVTGRMLSCPATSAVSRAELLTGSGWPSRSQTIRAGGIDSTEQRSTAAPPDGTVWEEGEVLKALSIPAVEGGGVRR